MKLKSRLWFLSCCVAARVVPATLAVNVNHQSGFNEEQTQMWREAQVSSQENFLKLAIEQVER